MRLKSVKAKTLVLFLPAAFYLFSIVLAVSYLYSRSIIVDQSRYGIERQMQGSSKFILDLIVSHTKLPVMVTRRPLPTLTTNSHFKITNP